MAEEHASSSFSFAPIGHVESCFRRLRGIPRQGALAPATKARLVLERSVQACAADDLEHFSHLWITFVFHDNRQPGEGKQRPGHQDYRAKISPPKLGRRVGVFSTRSPHRPNSIGQTVVRYEGSSRVELPRSPKYSKPRYVHALDISGVDFVDGTPVLDIKPYVAAYDSVLSATMAPWVEQAAASDSARHGALATVRFSPEARAQLEEKLGRMRFYDSVAAAEEAVRQVLSLDIHDGGARARKQKRGEEVDSEDFCFPFDGLEFIVHRGGQEMILTVVRVTDDVELAGGAQEPEPEPEPEPEHEPEPDALSDSDESGSSGGLDGFFTNTEYEERSWHFGSLSVRARCSNAASTDYDLTGQVPWPALTVLGHFLASERGGALVRGQSCLELGAGTGLPGLLAAAQGCGTLVLSDHNEYVVELLEQNVELNEQLFVEMAQPPLSLELDWERQPAAGSPTALQMQQYGDPDAEAGTEEGAKEAGFGVILASDCLYCEAAVKPLFDTATRWLADDGVWVMAHIARWENVEAALAAELASRPELSVEEVPLASFLPHAQRQSAATAAGEPPAPEEGPGGVRVSLAAAVAEAATKRAGHAAPAGEGGGASGGEELEGHNLDDAHLRLIRKR